MYDMVALMRNPNWKTSHLEGLNINPLTGATSKVIQHCFDTGNSLVFSKTNKGYPCDVKPYDANFIYDGLTEADSTDPNAWTSPNDYKANGWAMLPRQWNGDPSWSLYHASAQWTQFENCKQVSTGSVGPVSYSLWGPFLMDFGGDVGIQMETFLANYLWAGMKNREQLFLTSLHGWVMWTHATLQPSGFYQLDSISNHNLIVPGTVTPNFGCGTIK